MTNSNKKIRVKGGLSELANIIQNNPKLWISICKLIQEGIYGQSLSLSNIPNHLKPERYKK